MEKHHSLNDIANLIREIDIAAYLAISTAKGWQYLPKWNINEIDFNWNKIENNIKEVEDLCIKMIAKEKAFRVEFIVQPKMDIIKAEEVLCKNKHFKSTSAFYDFIYTVLKEKYENEISCKELDAI